VPNLTSISGDAPDRNVIVEIQGGLGNQLFRYAYGLSLAQRMGARLLVDTRKLNRRVPGVTPRDFALDALRVSPIHATAEELRPFDFILSAHPHLARLMRKWSPGSKFKFHKESTFRYQEFPEFKARSLYVQGYWQSARYFMNVADQLREMLEPKFPLSDESLQLRNEIADSNSLCVNVRRGDFTINSGLNFHGLLGVEYYQQATRILSMQNSVDRIFIFSDEPDWCEENLKLGRNQIIVSHRHAGPEFVHYLHLMAECKFFVVPNSTFAWWAVWLSRLDNPNVVAPANWFRESTFDTSDLIPESWTRL